MNTWKGARANLAVVDETQAYSPLRPVSPGPKPLLMSPAGTWYFPSNVHAHDREFFASWFKDTLMRCLRCGQAYGGFHICWNGFLHCKFCGQPHRATCDGVRWHVPEHDCPIIAPFLAAAQRFDRPGEALATQRAISPVGPRHSFYGSSDPGRSSSPSAPQQNTPESGPASNHTGRR